MLLPLGRFYFLLLSILLTSSVYSSSDEGSFRILNALKVSNSVRALRRAFRRAALEVHPDRAPILNTASDEVTSSSSEDETDTIFAASASASTSSPASPEILVRALPSDADVNADVFIRLRAAYDYRRAELEGRPLPLGRSPFDPSWGQGSTSSNSNADASSSSSTSSSGAYATGGDRCRAIKKARISSGVSWLSSWTLLTSTSPQSSTGAALGELNITLDMSFRGGSVPFTAHRVARCPFCKGSGVIINDTIPDFQLNNSCKTCGGEGFHTHGRCSWGRGGAGGGGLGGKNTSNDSVNEPENNEKGDGNSQNPDNIHTETKRSGEGVEDNDEEDEDDDFGNNFPGFGEAVYETCLDCCGTGKRLRDTHVCSECSGSGNVLRFHQGHLQLPRGLISEDRLPIQGIFTPQESDLASMKAEGVQFSPAPPGSTSAIPQVVWYPSKLRIVLDEEREISPFKLDPYPHLSRVVSLSLTHYCKLRRVRIRLPGTGPPPLPPVLVNGFVVPAEDTREVFEIHFPVEKTCFRGGGAGSLQHRLVKRGLPVSILRAKTGDDKPPQEEVGDFTLILQIQFPDRVGIAQSELFNECFGNESLPLIFSTAELVAEIEKIGKDIEVKRFWYNYEDEWVKNR